MARNNEERLGARQADTNPPPPSTVAPPNVESTPPAPADPAAVLSFSAPTEFVELPSKGKFYLEGHPLHNEDTIEIRYMTAKDEDILTSRALLKKGVAIDRLLQNIIVNKRIRVDDLLVGDKNAVLVAARVSGYGTEYATNVTCPHCAEVSNYTFDLNEISTNSFDEDLLKESNIELADDGRFLYTLPKSGFEVGIRLLHGRDEKNLLQTMQSSKKKKKNDEQPEELLTTHIRQILVSVDGVVERSVVNQFINVMPAMDARSLRHTYTLVMPNVDLTQMFECSECGQETTMEVPFGASFLWPK